MITQDTYVHIVIGLSFAGSMIQTLHQLGWSDTHRVVAFAENYAIGPLFHLDTYEGRLARTKWFHNNIAEALEYYTAFEDEYQDILHQIELISEQSKIVIWASDNVLEQIGLRHAVYLMRDTRNTLILMDACKTAQHLYNQESRFINYLHSGEVPSNKLQEVLLRIDEGKELSRNEINDLVQDWKKISGRHGNLRIWCDDAVVEVEDHFYDQYLLDQLDKISPPADNDGFLKSARLIGEAIGYCDQNIGYSYFEYRLRELIYGGILESKGNLAAMRYYSVRRKSY